MNDELKELFRELEEQRHLELENQYRTEQGLPTVEDELKELAAQGRKLAAQRQEKEKP